MNPYKLQIPIAYLKGISPDRASLLKSELGIATYMDLMHLFPHRYIDKTQYYKIRQLQKNSSEVQIVGQITHLQTIGKHRSKRLVATFKDDTGIMNLVWFRGYQWIEKKIKLHESYVIYGKVNWIYNSFSMPHPEMELLTEHEKGIKTAIQPVYPSTEKLTQKGVTNRVIYKCMQQLFQEIKGTILETLSQDILASLHFISKEEALWNIHFPKNQELLAKAQYRLKFEELFYIQLQLILKNLQHKKKIKGFPFKRVGQKFMDFYHQYLPFELTHAQKRVIKEIRKDLGSNAQMNRLLQGDVGSGKTMVSLLSMLLALDNDFQACLMAPTEILAQQHFTDIEKLLSPLGIEIALLTGSTKTKERKIIHQKLLDGSLQIILGTHALIEDKVKFKNLGLAIVDEQHRFGVAQRAKLWNKNHRPPHILVMTATPIPRTLAMSVYGDLDISIIDELPPGRKKIKTLHKYDSNRLEVFQFIREEIQKGRQVYVVYPLIEESEKLDYKDLMDGYLSLEREFPKPKYQISILHAKMKPTDKAFEMERFIRKETQIMVATTVIEVGVNVPNASVMIIESAERFGLSQLHQLRGRVGRGAKQSYCILISSFKLSKESKIRLEAMVNSNDGFEIAEIDLKLRGPGDIMGIQQSGILRLKIADIVRDKEILHLARRYAVELLKNDPQLEQEKNKRIRYTHTQLSKAKKKWNYIS